MHNLGVYTSISITFNVKLLDNGLNLCFIFLRELDIATLNILKGTLSISRARLGYE